MTQEEKELLTKDVFARALTGLKVDYKGETFTLGYNLYLEDGNIAFESYPMKFYLEDIETIKPYLRPMSSMTDKEQTEWHNTTLGQRWITENNIERCVDWLNSHHFDYRGLIEKGLALEAPKDIYKTE